MDFYSVFKHLAFQLDAERAHHMTLRFAQHFPASASLFPSIKGHDKYRFSRNNLTWSFPIGIAAGFDKNAQALEFFENLGIGALEVGTVTKKPQQGNPKPRIFRYPENQSIRNAMGFPNDGMEEIFNRLKKFRSSDLSIGANLGKNKETRPEDTPEEYAQLYKNFAPVSDYLVINISSPNTPGLRTFQSKEQLAPLLDAITQERDKNPKPLFLKISPDINEDDLKIVCELCKEKKLDGIIATNTTSQHNLGPGGLSGLAIKQISADIRKKVCDFLSEDPGQTIIGVGGVSSYEDLVEFWKQGGHLMQVYTSLIYQGPKLLQDFQTGIDKDLKKHQFKNVSELISNAKVL